MKKLMIPIILVILGITMCTSCRKKVQSKEVCKIQKIKLVTSIYLFNYDDQFRISSITNVGSVSSFTYEGNMVVINTTNDGSFLNKKTLTKNDAGLTVNIRTEYNVSGSSWENQVLEYSGNELIKLTRTVLGVSGSEIIQYFWSGGNMINYISNQYGPSDDYTYYTDKAYQDVDWLGQDNFLSYGFNFYNNKSLLKNINSGDDYIYDFNEKGLISSVKQGTLDLLTFDYTCRTE